MAVTITPSTLPGATVNGSYSQQLTAAGGTAPYTYAVTAGALPSGLTLSSAGLLSGSVTTTGSASFTVTATDSAGTPVTGTQAYSLSMAAEGAYITLACPSQMCADAGPVNMINTGANRVTCPRCEQVSIVTGGSAALAPGYHA